jgi:hypothetical protein
MDPACPFWCDGGHDPADTGDSEPGAADTVHHTAIIQNGPGGTIRLSWTQHRGRDTQPDPVVVIDADGERDGVELTGTGATLLAKVIEADTRRGDDGPVSWLAGGLRRAASCL